MINSIETVGLKVEKITPGEYSTDVDVNSLIEIEFNSELDVKTIVSNIFILKDTNRLVHGKPTELDLESFEQVKGSLTYKNRVVIFRPLNQLDSATRYIVYVPKGSVRDFKGRVSLANYIATFDTDGFAMLPPCGVVYPSNNSIINSLKKIEVEDIDSPTYVVQISKNSDFENGIYDEVIETNSIEQNFNIGDGSYYIRARATNGVFGEVAYFTIRTIPETLVSDEDEPFVYQPIEDELVEFVHGSPNGINSSEKSNLVYMKFNGIIPLEEIDFEESYLQGMLADDNDLGDIEEHGIIDGCFSVVYDDENNLTYILFIPEAI